jgi:hypothetical protein
MFCLFLVIIRGLKDTAVCPTHYRPHIASLRIQAGWNQLFVRTALCCCLCPYLAGMETEIVPSCHLSPLYCQRFLHLPPIFCKIFNLIFASDCILKIVMTLWHDSRDKKLWTTLERLKQKWAGIVHFLSQQTGSGMGILLCPLFLFLEQRNHCIER